MSAQDSANVLTTAPLPAPMPKRSLEPLLPATLRGIVPPMITPLLTPDTLDREGTRKLCDYIIAAKCSGIFILGTTGEGPHLSGELQRALIWETCTHVARRVPVLVGVSHASPLESIALASEARRAGASAVVLAPPCYAPMEQPELLECMRDLVPRLELPVFLYNIPSCTKTVFAPATLKALSAMESVVGFKDSAGDLQVFKANLAALKHAKDFSILVGPEPIMPEVLRLGAHGGVNGGANIFPALYVSMVDAATRGDQAEAKRLCAIVAEVEAKVYRATPLTHWPSGIVKGLKASLLAMGVISSDAMAQPWQGPTAEETKAVRKGLTGTLGFTKGKGGKLCAPPKF